MKTIIKKLKRLYWRIKSLGVRYYYGNPSKKLKIVGVTGTNGKTTIATLLYRMAIALGYKAGLISTVEILINGQKTEITNWKPIPGTTPDSVTLTKLFHKMAEANCEYVFMEVSSHALDQNRVAGINFAGGIFTNLTHDHLDYHQNFENYFEAKKKFFNMLNEKAFALSNVDDEYGLRMLEGIKAKKYTYGFKNKADFKEKLDTKLLGDFNAYNVLAVYASAILLGQDKEKVKEIIKNVTPPPGRFEHFTSKNGVLVIVDYAHTPDALQNVLRTVQGIRKNGVKIISMFGCGGDRDPIKRSIMGKIGAELSDLVIFTSDNPRSEDPEKLLSKCKLDYRLKILGK